MTSRSVLPSSPRGYDVQDQDYLRRFVQEELGRVVQAGSSTVGNSEIEGDFLIHENLRVLGDTILDGTLLVEGPTTINDTLTVNGDIDGAGDILNHEIDDDQVFVCLVNPADPRHYINQFIDEQASPGWDIGGELSIVGAPSLVVRVEAGEGWFTDLTVEPFDLCHGRWAQTDLTLNLGNAFYFIGVSRSGTTVTPIFKLSDTWNYFTEWPLGRVNVTEGTITRTVDLPFLVRRGNALNQQREIETNALLRAFDTGLVVGETDDTVDFRFITMTAGIAWNRFTRLDIAAIDTLTDLVGITFVYFEDTVGIRDEQDQKNWATLTTEPEAIQDQYKFNPQTFGDPIDDVPNNRFCVFWFGLDADGSLVGFFHDDTFTQEINAEEAAIPSWVPTEFSQNFIAKLIFREGETTARSIFILFDDTGTTTSLVSSHGDLSGLSADDHLQYALLEGRDTGAVPFDNSQTMHGGAAAGGDLVLRSNFVDFATAGEVRIESEVKISTDTPRILFEETDQGVDLKVWRQQVSAGTFRIQAALDTGLSGQDAYIIVRGATTNIQDHRWFTGASVERMRLVNAGNLLIGTTTDLGFRLAVAGDAAIEGDLVVTDTALVGAGITEGGTLDPVVEIVTGTGVASANAAIAFRRTGTANAVRAYWQNAGTTFDDNRGFYIGLTSAGRIDMQQNETAQEVRMIISSARMVWTPNGSILIGHTSDSPVIRLNVQGSTTPMASIHRTTTSQSQLDITNTTTGFGTGLRIGVTGAGVATINQQAAFDLSFNTSGTERMRIFANGRVAIGGVVDVGTKLLVDATGPATLPTISSDTTGTFARTTGNSIVTIIAANTASSIVRFGDPQSAVSGAIRYDHTDNSFQWDTNASERMRLTATGNLLIGTTTDGAERLLVAGRISATDPTDARSTADNGVARIGVQVISGSTAITTFTVNAMQFRINAVEQMRLSTLGNLLIGTTSDSGERLVVSGGVTALLGDVRVSNDIFRGASTDRLTITGGTTSILGGAISLRGESEVTNPGGIQFLVSNSEIARFVGTTGNLLLGSTTDGGDRLRIAGTTFGSGIAVFDTTQQGNLRSDSRATWMHSDEADTTNAYTLLVDGGSGGNVFLNAITLLNFRINNVQVGTWSSSLLTINTATTFTTDTTLTGNLFIENTSPFIVLQDTDDPVDQGLWRIHVTNLTFRIRTADDANGSPIDVYRMTRGTTTSILQHQWFTGPQTEVMRMVGLDVLIGTTAQITGRRLVVAGNMRLQSDTATLTVGNNTNTVPTIEGLANRTVNLSNLFSIASKWNGATVATITFRSGSTSATTKDDGLIIFQTKETGVGILDRARFIQNGDFLIGSTTDNARLYVFTDSGVVCRLEGSANNEVLRLRAASNPFMSILLGSTRHALLQSTTSQTLLRSEIGGMDLGCVQNFSVTFRQFNLERMRIASTSGNLLIGTTTDAVSTEKLQVLGRISARDATDTRIIVKDDPAVTQLAMRVTGGVANIGTLTNTPWLFHVSGLDVGRWTTGQNLLIGTAIDGGDRLEVNGNIRLSAASSIVRFVGTSGFVETTGGSLFLRVQTNAAMTFSVNFIEGMRLAVTTANVLIGTTTDSGDKLRVFGGTTLLNGNLAVSSSAASITIGDNSDTQNELIFNSNRVAVNATLGLLRIRRAGLTRGTLSWRTGAVPADDCRMILQLAEGGVSRDVFRVEETGLTTVSDGSLVVASLTGRATIVPTDIQSKSKDNGSDWDTTNPWAQFSFLVADGSGIGSTVVRALIGSQFENATGSLTNMVFHVSDASSRFEAMRIVNDGGVLVDPAVTGGSQGLGTINSSGGFFENGVKITGTGGGGISPGTTGRHARYDGTGTDVQDSAIQDNLVTGVAMTIAVTTGNILINRTTDPGPTLVVDEPGTSTFPTMAAQTVAAFAKTDGNAYISIISGDTNDAVLRFGHTTDENRGNVEYDHSSDSMKFRTDGAPAMELTSSGKLLIHTSTNAGPSLLVDPPGSSTFPAFGTSTIAGFVRTTGDASISIIGSPTNTCEMFFGDSTTERLGAIEYDIAERRMNFIPDIPNAATPMRLVQNSGNVRLLLGTLTDSGPRLQVVDPSLVVPGIDTQVTAMFVRSSQATNNAIILVLSGNTGQAELRFGDTDNDNRGRIEYDNLEETLVLRSGSTRHLSISNDGGVCLPDVAVTTGGSQGIGTLNVSDGYFVQGARITAAGSCLLGSVLTSTAPSPDGLGVAMIRAGGSIIRNISSPVAGKLMVIKSTITSVIVSNEDGSVTASERFTLRPGANVSLASGETLILMYDDVALRWIQVSDAG